MWKKDGRSSGTRDDIIFKALADAGRRRLLDRIRARGGRTLGDLCVGMGMSRQAVAKHLRRLEAAGLVVPKRVGREKRHYLNPLPVFEIEARWILPFDQRAWMR